MSYTLVCLNLFCIFRGKKTKEMLLVRGKLSFLYVDILFDMTKCKFIVKNSSLKCWFAFLHIFVADTKIIFVYHFVALLRLKTFLYFLRKKSFFYFGKWNFLTVKSSYISGGNFPSSNDKKNKENLLRKNFFYFFKKIIFFIFQKMELSTPEIKTFLTFFLKKPTLK